MNDDWILEVLADLKAFAKKNNLPFLASRLDDTQRLAAIELAMRKANDGSLRDKDGAALHAIPICVRSETGSFDS